MNLRQSAVKGVIWSSIEAWGGQAISFIVFSLLARLLNSEVFGLIALASLFIAFMQVFIDQGFGEAIVAANALGSRAKKSSHEPTSNPSLSYSLLKKSD